VSLGVGIGLASLAIGIVGLIAGYIYFRSQRTRKGLIYQVVSNSPLVMATDRIGGQLTVAFNDKPVDDANLMIIRFVNSGNVPILSSDFSGALRVKLTDDAKVLSAEITETTPASLEPAVQATTAGNVVDIAPLLLNAGDSFSLRLFVDHSGPDVSVVARIVGISDVRAEDLVAPEQQEDRLKLVGTALGFILTLAGAFIVWFFGTRP
jgi:hypothetical protein